MLEIGKYLLNGNQVRDRGQPSSEPRRNRELAQCRVVIDDHRKLCGFGYHPIVSLHFEFPTSPIIGRDHLLSTKTHPRRLASVAQGFQGGCTRCHGDGADPGPLTSFLKRYFPCAESFGFRQVQELPDRGCRDYTLRSLVQTPSDLLPQSLLIELVIVGKRRHQHRHNSAYQRHLCTSRISLTRMSVNSVCARAISRASLTTLWAAVI